MTTLIDEDVSKVSRRELSIDHPRQEKQKGAQGGYLTSQLEDNHIKWPFNRGVTWKMEEEACFLMSQRVGTESVDSN